MSRATQKLTLQLLLHRHVRKGATPFSELLYSTLEMYLIMLSFKQGGIKYHFLSLWYVSAWDWTPVSQTISKHSTTKPIYISYQRFKKLYLIYIDRFSFAIHPYHPLLLADSLSCILCLHRADVCKSLLVSQTLVCPRAEVN